MPGSVTSISFLRRVAQFGAGRWAFTLSPDIARLISPQQMYQVTLRPVGTIVVQYVG